MCPVYSNSLMATLKLAPAAQGHLTRERVHVGGDDLHHALLPRRLGECHCERERAAYCYAYALGRVDWYQELWAGKMASAQAKSEASLNFVLQGLGGIQVQIESLAESNEDSESV